MTLQRDQAPVWDYITSSASTLKGRTPSGSVVSTLKHKLSKREYKVVLSKTYIRTILLMLRYQGKGKWGCNAEALTWLSCTMTTKSQDERRTRVHLVLNTTSIHHHGFSLDFPTRKQSKALTLLLRFLEYPFEFSNNQVKVSK